MYYFAHFQSLNQHIWHVHKYSIVFLLYADLFLYILVVLTFLLYYSIFVFVFC